MDSFKYFLECYFNCSTNYNVLNNIIEEFIDAESANYVNGLMADLITINRKNNLLEAQGFIKKYGMRNIGVDKVKLLIEFILRKLRQAERKNLHTNIFYSLRG